ncbi:hypothetical protein G7Y89_g6956 [Cudoniella acicularis]|uniref:Heterokaryon incompatibility domain-containing protein n=1 Tax=Cudoniella acicularis TaxID=354080 RepID=A0A8H4RKA1_9HELO|nr:hypothetical protein G7Y89_g6956 [Cudoniella acicularis]
MFLLLVLMIPLIRPAGVDQIQYFEPPFRRRKLSLIEDSLSINQFTLPQLETSTADSDFRSLGEMNSDSSDISNLCERCASWDVENLFQGEPEDAYQVGPLQQEQWKNTWDRRPIEEVRQNVHYKLCQLVYSVVIASPGWKIVKASTSKLYIGYEKLQFGCRYLRDSGKIPESITILGLRVYDNWDPGQSSSTFNGLEFPKLQAFGTTSFRNTDSISKILSGRPVDNEVNFNLVRSWITCCDDLHGAYCATSAPHKQNYQNIRLIDVRRRRIVRATTVEKYAALSYVWGIASVPQTKFTRSSAREFVIDGALAESNGQIPRTIGDAMVVCERLSIPFLWVDALCIEQDSQNIDIHLNMMNDIYSAAYLTIVAASGVDSWAGLPGVMPNLRETSKPSVTIRCIEIGLALPDFAQTVILSPWARRGWTFQEQLFSKRLLVFTEQQIFFECYETSRSESNITEVDAVDQGMRYWFNSSYAWSRIRSSFKTSLGSLNRTYLERDDTRSFILGNYLDLTRSFRKLELTYQSDVLRAFAGVISTVKQQLACEIYFGIPVAYSVGTLLLDHLQCVRRPEYPSWSWAAWAKNCDLHPSHWHMYLKQWALEAEEATTFYCLPPYLNASLTQETWTLEVLASPPGRTKENSQGQVAIPKLPGLANLDDLKKLLVFDALGANFEVAISDTNLLEEELEFDRANNMARGSTDGMHHWGKYEGTGTFQLRPYFPREWFNMQPVATADARWVEFVQIARDQKGEYVGLMVVDTNEMGISSRVCCCVASKEDWLRAEPNSRRVYLM